MDEWLAIRVPKLGSWRSPKPDCVQCAKDLKPRDDEDSKSAWAHVDVPAHHHQGIAAAATWGAQCAALFSDAASVIPSAMMPVASRDLQALALLLFSSKANKATLSRIWILSIRRDTLAAGLVANDPSPHIVDAYNWTHRGLLVKPDTDRASVVTSTIDSGYHRSFYVRDYTADELMPLLRQLMAANLIADEYVDVARSIADVQPHVEPPAQEP